ncbi:hypothetical protein EJB05_47046, partial [Eragrostis curvula]
MQEYTDRVDTAAEKTYSIDRFNSGLPSLSKNGNAGKNRWSFRKEGMQGRQLTCTMRILYQGQTEGLQSATATYYMLMMQGKDFHAILLVRGTVCFPLYFYVITLCKIYFLMKRQMELLSSDVKKLDNVNEGITGGVHPKKGDRNEDGDQSGKGEEGTEGGIQG